MLERLKRWWHRKWRNTGEQQFRVVAETSEHELLQLCERWVDFGNSPPEEHWQPVPGREVVRPKPPRSTPCS